MIDKYIVPTILVMTMILSISIYIMLNNVRNNNDLISPNYDIKTINENELLAIDNNMAYGDIIKKLGKTKDVGSGVHVAQYIINDKAIYLSFVEFSDNCEFSGQELLDNAVPFNEQADITGTITSLYKGDKSVTIMVEANLGDDPIYDKASVTVNKDTIIYKDGFNNVLFGYNILEIGDQVQITFTGAVLESYPIQATAKKIKLINENTISQSEER